MTTPRTNLLLCLASAALGSLLTAIWMSDAGHGPQLKAQEPLRIPSRDSGFDPAVRVAPTQPPLISGQPPLPIGQESMPMGQAPLAMGPSRLNDPVEELMPEERTSVAVYEACNRSVVNINTTVTGTSLFIIDVVQDGAGSGAVFDKQGHILTNFHVIEGARDIQVNLFDGKSYPGKLVGRDPSTDICVLKIDAPAESLFPVQMGDSTRLKVGQHVFALGNPFGLERTLTTGIISSLNRSLPARNNRVIKSVIQTDAAINPGNSGGPLLDSRGRLIGMNTAIASKHGQNTGVGFAIPSSVIMRVVPELISKGFVTRPETGIHRVAETDQGLKVATLVPGGPAEQAGLRGFKIVRERKRQGPFVYEAQSVDRSAADVIVAVDGQPTKTADEFLSIVESRHPGEEVTITVVRQGQQVPIRLRLAAGESGE